MFTKNTLTEQLAKEFTPSQAALLSDVIIAAYTDLVKTGDFNELKEIVRDLAEAQQQTVEAQQRTEERLGQLTTRMDSLAKAQQRTEERLGQLTIRMDSLAKAQQRTEERMDSLAKAQQRTEERMDSLAEAQQRTEEALQLLAHGLRETRSEVAGLGRQFGYALENEAYRALPSLLRERYAIEVTRRFIRTYVRDREINLLAEGRQNDEPILLVGEVKSHLGSEDFEQLEQTMEIVRQAQAEGDLPNYRIVPVFVAHVARSSALKRAETKGIIVVQSFEW